MVTDLLIAKRTSFTNDEQAMQQALELAKQAEKEQEVPVGAVVIYKQRLIGWGHNKTIQLHDSTAHAEIQAMRMASRHLQNYRLPECEMFVTLEPCCMCFGAIIQSRIKRVVFAASDPKTGACGSVLNLHEHVLNNHTTVESGLLSELSAQLLKDFFASRRQQKQLERNKSNGSK